MSSSAFFAGHGNGQYPPPLGPPAQAAAGGLPQISIHTVLVALRCWWHVALPMGLLLAAGAATVVYYITTPTYTATAWIYISQRPTNPMPGAVGEDPRRFIANQKELMRSNPVVEPLISQPAVRSAPELRDEVDPVLYLRRNIRVSAIGESDYFEIGFTSEDPVKAALIVNELAHSYMQLYATTDSQVSQKVIEYVMELANEQLAEYKRLRGDVEALTEQTAGQGFPAKQDAKPTKDPIQQQLELELLDAEIELLMIEAELRAEKAVFGREDFTPPEDLVAIRLAADPELAQRKAALTIKKEKRDEHKKVTKNPDQDNALKQREQVIAADEQRIQELTAERRKEIESELSKTARIKREAQIAKLEFDHDKLLHKCEYLKSRLQTNRSEQKSTAGKTLDLELASSDMESARERYDALTIKVQQLKADQRAPERVRPFQSATVPTRPDEEIPLKKMIMAALAAMLLPFGLAVGIEVLFGRVANRKQLESASRVSVVGEITSLPRRLKGQVSGDAPRRDVQLFEESINGLRTYLTLIEASRGRRVLAVTSSISREGKTSLAAQLAMSVANSTGKPTLLIDGDMRSPDIHRIFDVEVGPGLAEVLTGRVPLEEAIETEVSSRLHLLTAGRLSASPHQLTGGGEFAATIERLREMYENIIIDTPPILSASEALIMAGAADATIVCVRRDYSRVDQVSESVQRLVASGVKVAGAVLNGVPTQHYAYRYGSYYYTRQRTEEVAADTAEEPRAAG